MRPLNAPDRAFTSEAVHVPVKWQWGRLQISEDDITFIDEEPPARAAGWTHGGAPVMSQDLVRDPAFIRLALDPDGPWALKGVLQQDFVRGSDDLRQEFWSNDDIAELIAAARGLNEDLLDISFADAHDRDRTAEMRQSVLEHLVSRDWWLAPHTPANQQVFDELQSIDGAPLAADSSESPEERRTRVLHAVKDTLVGMMLADEKYRKR